MKLEPGEVGGGAAALCVFYDRNMCKMWLSGEKKRRRNKSKN